MLLEEETECFCFLAGHESFAAAEGAIGIAEKANKVRQKPLRVILTVLEKMLHRLFHVLTDLHLLRQSMITTGNKVKEVYEKSYSDGLRAS